MSILLLAPSYAMMFIELWVIFNFKFSLCVLIERSECCCDDVVWPNMIVIR